MDFEFDEAHEALDPDNQVDALLEQYADADMDYHEIVELLTSNGVSPEMAAFTAENMGRVP